MTDLDRFPDWSSALAALPPRSGVILRDYAHVRRPELARAMFTCCRQHGHQFFIGADSALALRLGAGYHAPARCATRPLPRALRGRSLAAAHSRAEIDRAARNGFSGVLVSPVFPTASHIGAPGLGAFNFLALAHYAALRGLCVYALGGLDETRFKRLAGSGAVAGYAAITALHSGAR